MGHLSIKKCADVIHDATLVHMNIAYRDDSKDLVMRIILDDDIGDANLNGRSVSIVFYSIDYAILHVAGFVSGRETIDDWVFEIAPTEANEALRRSVAVVCEHLMSGLEKPMPTTVSFNSGGYVEVVCRRVEVVFEDTR